MGIYETPTGQGRHTRLADGLYPHNNINSFQDGRMKKGSPLRGKRKSGFENPGDPTV